jgi:hypothetical protein
MELIKKTVYRIMTTGTTTGCTGTCRVIIPDTGVTYNLKILINQEVKDAGFFDAYMLDSPFDYIQLSGATSVIRKQKLIKFKSFLTGGTTLAASGLVISHSDGGVTGTTGITNTLYTVTGECTSRLLELQKYTVSSAFTAQYFSGGSYTVDGVDYPNSFSGVSITYYLGGIKYIDLLTGTTSGSTFTFTTQGYFNPNFINKPIYQDPNKENIISNPKISNDVFIIRQELPAFDGNYRLEYIRKLVDLETYAAGKFFNVINNT